MTYLQNTWTLRMSQLNAVLTTLGLILSVISTIYLLNKLFYKGIFLLRNCWTLHMSMKCPRFIEITFPIMYTNPVRTSQETHNVSATEPNRLMVCGETVAVCCENRKEHTDTLCGQSVPHRKHITSPLQSQTG
jgi:hypothetical protein